jgi:hypothetical protein
VDKDVFLTEQFKTLRAEIENTKDRIFKTLTYGIAVVPAAHYAANELKLSALLYATPLLVMVVALLYLSENHALMRCGRYIRREIEPHFSGVVGWEEWLEIRGMYDARTVDKLLSYSFYLLFFVYFAASVALAFHKALGQYGLVAAAALLGSYIAVGIWFLIYLYTNLRTSTQTSFDANQKRPPARDLMDITVGASKKDVEP